ncbi:MAG: glycosyltransferase family 2 protein [Verrucomicrobiota bacterium]|nr:glycosyltransferase family 2 protein [Verrucomicrobiota bacterium]
MTLSVFIPTYNRPALLRRAIQSCLDQTTLPEEIIVVDNGTNPQTRAVVESFSGTPLVIRYLTSPLFNFRAALSTGISNLKSDWAINLDDDDFLLPWRIENDLKLLQTIPNDVILVAHHFARVDYKNEVVWVHELDQEKINLFHVLAFEGLGPPASTTIRTNLLKAHHPFDLGEGNSDYDLYCSILPHGKSMMADSYGYIMDDTRTGLRRTDGNTGPVDRFKLQMERYKHLLPIADPPDGERLRSKQERLMTFFVGKHLFNKAAKNYFSMIVRHPIMFLMGMVSHLRPYMSFLPLRLTPKIHGARQISFEQFSRNYPELMTIVEKYRLTSNG